MKNIGFNEFVRVIVENLKRRYIEAKVEVQEITKNNGNKLTGIFILGRNTNIAPTIYLEYYYEEYMSGKTIDWVIQEIVAIYERNKMSPIDISFFMDYEKIKQVIAMKLVNYHSNMELLRNIPHFRFLDLAITFYCVLGAQEAYITITNEHLRIWNISKERLYEWAKGNTEQVLPWELIDMAEVVRKMAGDNEIPLEKLMYILTNKKKQYGATCMLYDGVLREIAQRLQSDFYILPSSVHEVILLPTNDDSDRKELTEMVLEVNNSILSKEDMLSDHVYYFSKVNGIIEM